MSDSIASKSAVLELAVGLYDFDPVKPTDLGFREGDVLQIVKRADNKNWWKAKRIVDSADARRKSAAIADGTDAQLNEDEPPGDVPKTYIRVFDPSAVVIATAAWEAQDGTEIGFTKGTVLLVHEKHETGWWKGRTISDKKLGIFPGTYVREFSSPPPLPKSNLLSQSDTLEHLQQPTAGTYQQEAAVAEEEEEPEGHLVALDQEVLSTFHGAGSSTFSLDDFDAFDLLMARGWCFNPDFPYHNLRPGTTAPVAQPGQQVYVQLSMFRWDGDTGGLTRLASSCGGAAGTSGSGMPVSFRVQHESWLDEQWMVSGNGVDGTVGWAGGSKIIGAVHRAVQEMSLGATAELVAAPAQAFGDDDFVMGTGVTVVRSSQVVVRLGLVGLGDIDAVEEKHAQVEEDWDPDLNPRPVKRGIGGGERAGRVLLQVEGDDAGTEGEEGTIEELERKYASMHGEPHGEGRHERGAAAGEAEEEEDDELAAWDRQMVEAAAATSSNAEPSAGNDSIPAEHDGSIGGSGSSGQVNPRQVDSDNSGGATTAPETADIEEVAPPVPARKSPRGSALTRPNRRQVSSSSQDERPPTPPQRSKQKKPELGNGSSSSSSSVSSGSLDEVLSDKQFLRVFGQSRETFLQLSVNEQRQARARVGYFPVVS